MTTEESPRDGKPWGAARAIFWGTVAVGVLDLLDAFVFFGLRGATPIRILQSIAGGLLGREAYKGGLPTALLGVSLHFFIAFCIVCTYYFASRRIALLRRRPVLCGLAYGVLVYFFMNYVVIPLSALGPGKFSLPVFLNGVIGHALLVGLPSALAARRGERGDEV